MRLPPLSRFGRTGVFQQPARAFIASGQTLPADLNDHPPLEEWRCLDYSTTVTRLYQIFESLVHDSVAEWLGSLSSLVAYPTLPVEVQIAHRGGIGFILQNFDGRRFEGMSPAKIIKDYDGALSGTNPYSLLDEAFLLHERNLRLEEVQTILKSCGVKVNLQDWVKNHRVSKHDSLPLISHTSVDKGLASFIDLRNEASHATRRVGEVIGDDTLVAYVRFIRALCEAIVEAMLLSSLQWHSEHGNWTKAGRIESVVTGNKRICVAPLQSCRIRQGDSIYISGTYQCLAAKIEEIRIEDQVVTDYVIGLTPKEVGLRLDIETYKNAIVWVESRQPAPTSPTQSLAPLTINLDDQSEDVDVDAELPAEEAANLDNTSDVG